VPPVKPAPRAEAWPLAASSLVTEPALPAEPPVSTTAEPPVWSSLESLFINAAEHPSVEEPPSSPEVALLAEPLVSTTTEPPVWSSIESLLNNVAEYPPVEEPPPSPEPASEPPFSSAEEPPVWSSIESLFINAAEHPPVPEPTISPEPTTSWMSDAPETDASFDVVASAPPREVVAPVAPKEIVAETPKEPQPAGRVPTAATYPDEPEWRDLVASFRRAVDALEIEAWLAVGAVRSPEAAQLPQPAQSPQSAKPDEEPCDEWGFYDPARYGLNAVLNKIDRMDGPNKHTR
jgi:hypothetical protein